MARPHHSPCYGGVGVGVDGSTFLDINGMVWDTQLGIAQNGLFPVGGRLSFFLPAWQRITSDKFVLEVIRQGFTLPFVRPPPLSLSPVETTLLLLSKRLALWEEVSSLLNKRAVDTVDLSQDQGGFYSHFFLATKRTGGFHPILSLHGFNSFIGVTKFRMETLSSILQGLHKVGGWCRWISRMLICMYRYTVSGDIFGLLSGTRQGSSLFTNGKFSLLA